MTINDYIQQLPEKDLRALIERYGEHYGAPERTAESILNSLFRLSKSYKKLSLHVLVAHLLAPQIEGTAEVHMERVWAYRWGTTEAPGCTFMIYQHGAQTVIYKHGVQTGRVNAEGVGRVEVQISDSERVRMTMTMKGRVTVLEEVVKPNEIPHLNLKEKINAIAHPLFRRHRNDGP